MKRFSDWSIRNKMFLLLVLSVIILVVSLSSYYIRNLVIDGRKNIDTYRREQNQIVENKLTNLVDVAYATINSNYSNSRNEQYLAGKYGPKLQSIIDIVETLIKTGKEDAAAGRISLEDAQQRVLKEIKALRYDNGTGYIWVNDTEKPFPKMIMHPTVPALDGRIMDDPKYNTVGAEKKNLFTAFVDVCEASGQGFVKYMWPKPTGEGLTEEQPKLSYVKLIPDWNWIVGTGIYVDDAVTDAKRQALETLKAMRYDGGVGYFWINDTEHPFPVMIMHPTSPGLDGKVMDDPKYNTVGAEKKNLFTAFVDVCEASGHGFVEYMWPKPTKDGLTAEQPKKSYVRLFEPWNWIIGSGVYTDDIIAAVQAKSEHVRAAIVRSVSVSGGISIILLVLILIVTGLIMRTITRPIAKIVFAVKQAAEGVLTERIHLKKDVNCSKELGCGKTDCPEFGKDDVMCWDDVGSFAGESGKRVHCPSIIDGVYSSCKECGVYRKAMSMDEAGELAHSFNLLVERLKGSVMNIQVSSARNVEIQQDLSLQSKQTTSSLSEISGNIDVIKNQITSLADNIYESSNATEQINRNTKSLGKRIDEQAAMVEQSTASITEMIASIGSISNITRDKKTATDTLVSTAMAGGEKLENTSVIIGEINKSIGDISGTADVISGIAAQTNLLAMNAAIEAAHAGEVGKGFSVVADEIRKLAETSQQNSKNITDIIREVIGRIEQASDSSIETSKAFEEIYREVKSVAAALDEINTSMNELNVGGQEILQAVSVLQDITVKVKESAAEMSDGSESVTQSMGTIKDISSGVTEAINEIQTGTSDIAKAADSVLKLTLSIGEIVDKLDEEARRFKVS